MRLGPVADARQVGSEGVRDDVVGVSDEDGGVPDAGVAGDVLDHLGVVIGGQERLVLAAVGHRQVADEVGQPHVVAPLELGVLVPEVIDVPRFVPDDEVVQPLLHDLLEHHEVGHQDLVHPSERLEAVQVVLAGLRRDVRGLVGQPGAGRVDALALGLEDARHGMLGQPVDLQLGMESLQLLDHGDVAAGMTEPDRR